jgi:predicted dehydrogenase
VISKIRFGVVGAGTMGQGYARAFAAGAFGPHVELGGVCDIDATAARGLGEETDVPWFTGIDELLAGVQPDAVYIAVPDPLHREPFLAAVRHGAAIIVEKPLATAVEDAEAMHDAAVAAGVLAEVNFSNRWNPPFVSAKQAIDRGDIGRVVGLNARLNNAISSPTRMLTWASRTTSAWFLLSHVLDLARWLDRRTAETVWANGVRGTLAERGIDTYDIIQALVRYTDGSTGVFESAWALPESMPSAVDFKYEIVGTQGAIYVDTHDQMVHVAGRTAYQFPQTLTWSQPRMAAFTRRLQAGDRSAAMLADGVENTRLLVALHASLASGGPVAVQPGPPAASTGGSGDGSA